MSEITEPVGTRYYQGTTTTGAGTMNAEVLQAIGRQVSAELRASHQYLAMAAFCELNKFTGAARWHRIQSQEERNHALKLFDFVLIRNAAIELEPLPSPTHEFKDLADVFVEALLQEERTTAQINELYELAFASKAFAEMAELQWFVTEQVEEEHTARQWVARFQMVGNDPGSLLDLDRELGARTPTV
jgi:ferritin